jgi:Uma2 family endonuclease
MATALSTPPAAPAPPAQASDIPMFPVYRFQVEQYHALIAAGILTADDRVELLEGWVVPIMPINPPHRRATERTFAVLNRLLPAGWYVTMHQPITTTYSEPEPDVAIIRGNTDDYPDRHPGPKDLGPVIEVADSTLAANRQAKRILYARASIQIYWIINLVDRQVEVHTDPTGPVETPTYARREVFDASSEVPVILDGREVGRIAVRDILP